MREHDARHAQRFIVELVIAFRYIVEITGGIVSLGELTQPDVCQHGQVLVSRFQREDTLDGRKQGQERL